MLKLHIDQLDEWMRQATDMVYAIEEKIMDIEDAELENKKYSRPSSMRIFRNAGSEHQNDCPPRHFSNTCGEHVMSSAGFYQPDFNLNKFAGVYHE
jgi:hypothetical protein